MAQPFFRGNYGSALARVDTRPIMEAGRAQGQMYANLGGQIGGMIKEYGLNKQKKEKATSEVENMLELYPEYADRLTQSGDETTDKKNLTTLDKLQKGELGLAGLEGLAGKLALMEKQDKKERDEAEMRRQIALDMLKREQISLDMNVKREGLAAEKKASSSREKVFGVLQQDLLKAQAKLRNDPNAKFSNKERQLLANPEVVMNMQGDPAIFRADPMGDRMKDLQAQGLEQGLEKGEFELISAEQDVELTEKELAEADRIPMFKDNAAVLEYKASLPSGATAKFNKKGTGFDLESISLTAEAEEQMTPVDGMPGYSLYSGGLYKAEDVGGKKTLTKVTAQSFGKDVEMLAKGIDIMDSPELREYGKARNLHYDRLDDGTYVYKDSNGDDVEVPFSSEYEDQLFELEKMKANYKKRLGDNLIDLRSR